MPNQFLFVCSFVFLSFTIFYFSLTKLSEFGLFNGKQSLFIHFMFTIFRSCRHAVIASYFGDSEPKVHTCTILGTCSKLLVVSYILD